MIISAAKAHEAAEVLSVNFEELTPDTLRRAYHNKAKDCHPDHHGSAHLQTWARVSWAKECLGHWLAQHPPTAEPAQSEQPKGDCRVCGGTGRVKVGTYGSLTIWCVMCEGSGSVITKEDREHG